MTRNRKPICLEEALAELSQERASEDFTQRVLDGLGHRRPSKLPSMSTRWVAMFAALAAIALALGYWTHPYLATEPTVQDESAKLLRQEYETLQSEVAALRTLAAQPQPVLYLGGDRQVDLVLDLGQSDFDPTKLDIRPAATGTRRVEPDGRIQ